MKPLAFHFLMRHLIVTFISFFIFGGMRRSALAQPAGHNPSWIQGQASLRAVGARSPTLTAFGTSAYLTYLVVLWALYWFAGRCYSVSNFTSGNCAWWLRYTGWESADYSQLSQLSQLGNLVNCIVIYAVGSWHCWHQLCIKTLAVSGQEIQQIALSPNGVAYRPS